MPNISGPSNDMEAKYRAESDLRTLVEAQEIKADAKRFKAALAIGREKASALAKVQKSA